VTRYDSLSKPSTSTASLTTQIPGSIYSPPDAGKEALNLLTLISELYNAGVVGSGLIYDLVRTFLDSEAAGMGEGDVEGILKVLRCESSPGVGLAVDIGRLRRSVTLG
jgi:nucleolar MIF4G domain-containing protein 1